MVKRRKLVKKQTAERSVVQRVASYSSPIQLPRSHPLQASSMKPSKDALKVLFLASYFPKPDNTVMGTWALSQAQAIARQGADVKVVSFTSALPKWVARSPGARAYAHCPDSYVWPGAISAQYPRWLYYPIEPLKRAAHRHPLPYLKLAAWSAKEQLLDITHAYQPDVIFCHHSLPNGWLAAQLQEAYSCPLFVLEHDYDEIADCQWYPQRQQAMVQVAQRVNTLFAVSQRMEKNMQAVLPQATTATLHNGIALPAPHYHQTPRPREIQNLKVISVCALFAQRKGVPLLIEAFNRISARHPDAILRIVGAGPEENKIKQTITRLNVQAKVHLLGKLPHEAVLQELAWSDCFALVGWDEPFATVYLEAMAASKPILCCNDGGINDVITDGRHGYTVPPKNVAATAAALDKLLSRDAARIEMGQNARQLIETQLTWDAKAADLIRYFEQAVSRAKRSCGTPA